MKELLENISRYWQVRFLAVGGGVLLIVYAVVMPVHSDESTSIPRGSVVASASTNDASIPTLVGSGDKVEAAALSGTFASPWLGENHAVASEFGVVARNYLQEDLPRDFTGSIRSLRKAAEAGDPAAQFLLGHAYQQGFGVSKDMTQTAVWYARAAEARTSGGVHAVTDLTHALDSYRAAAEGGDVGAQLYLGLSYDFGQDAPQSAVEAARWYRKAAERGSTSAANNLGALYHDGDGIPKDDAEAVAWFERAAASGSAKAEFSLGRMYLQGFGAPRNEVKAAEWLEKSANHGNAAAQVLLGELYATGRGVPGNTAIAYKWIDLASATDDQVRLSRDHIESAILPKEVAEGQKMAHEWVAKHPHTLE